MRSAEMILPSAVRVPVLRREARAPPDSSGHDSGHAAPSHTTSSAAGSSVRVSSHSLGWAALNYERRDYQPSSRALTDGVSEHLVFVSLTSGRIMRSSPLSSDMGEQVEHELHPGCVAIVPARTPISWSWSTRVSFSILRLNPGLVDRVAQSVFGLQPNHYRLTLAERRHDTAITNIAGVLAGEVMRGERGSGLYAESLASILSVHLLRRYAQCTGGRALPSWAPIISRPELPPDFDHRHALAASLEAGRRTGLHPRAVSDALAFIHANYARELSLADLAQAVRLSPFHLARLFKQSLGVSPHRYLIQVRVNSARWLLSLGSGERSLAEVATAVGFADQSHLTRHFKRMTGVTPRRFRPRYEVFPSSASALDGARG